MTLRHRNTLWGRVLMDELARAGLRHIVISPGSRSTPIVLAAAEDERFEVHVQIDERSAGFLALGVGKATGMPAAVVTTSGTAVANLMPAVVEASSAEVPLLLLTADRPAHLRGTDANQTIDQVRIFGRYTRFFRELPPGDGSEALVRNLRSCVCRAFGAATGCPAGPVHLNLPFEKPLEPSPDRPPVTADLASLSSAGTAGRADGAPWTRIAPRRSPPEPREVRRIRAMVSRSRRPVLVAGVLPQPWETGPALRRVARGLGVPLLADPLSGARYPSPGDDPSDASPVVGGYELALRSPEVRTELRPDLVIRVGSSPTSSFLTSWLSETAGIPHILVDAGGRWKDHTASATEAVRADPILTLEGLLEDAGVPRGPFNEWSALWLRVEDAVRKALEESRSEAPFEGNVIAETALALTGDDLLFVSSSMAVRDLDAFVARHPTPLPVLGNRGASGIDGITSTAAGASIGTGRRVVALMGDLALLHDTNGLSVLRNSPARVVLVVVNNDGGGIFHLLPIRRHEPAFTPLFATPHGLELSHLAALYELPHRRIDLRGVLGESEGAEEMKAGLGEALSREGSGILEIRTDREENRLRRGRCAEMVSTAAATALGGEHARADVLTREEG